MKHNRFSSWYVLGAFAFVTILSISLVGCLTDNHPTAPAETLSQTVLFDKGHPQIQSVMAIQNRHTKRLMADPEVVGTATGLNDAGQPAILVLLKSERGRAAVPKSLDGTPVVALVTGPIKAMKGPGGGADHKARQTRPIELGVSGGNAYDLANGYCCSGTLGALVEDEWGTQYILSNSHVLCNDIAASEGDPDIAQIGDPINQPGLIDVYCQDIPNDYVANLSKLTSLVPPTNVDASYAEVMVGKVRTDGSILEVGTISSTTVTAYVGQKVKKSGRTTGLTRSKVSGINATVNVGYEDECNGQPFTVLYTGQILITNRGSKFLSGGDSGSLMVEDIDTDPGAVGLLYAGSSTIAVANPIDDVLTYLEVTLVGN